MTLFNGHKSYQNEVKTLFQSVMPSKAQYRVCFGILQKLQSIIVQKASEPINTAARETAQMKLKNIQQSKGSRAKTRYIGGWCVAATKRRKKSFVTINLYKKSLKFQVNKQTKNLNDLASFQVTKVPLQKVQKNKTHFQKYKESKQLFPLSHVLQMKCFNFFKI